MPNFDFPETEHTKYLWKKILSHWLQRDRHARRFLGSVCLKQQDTDNFLNVVGRNLRQLRIVTHHFLYEHYDVPEKNWLKILSFLI